MGGVFFAWVGIAIAQRIRRGSTVYIHVFAGHRIALADADGVLDNQVGVEQARELDDAEDHQQQDRQDQGELHHALATRPAPGQRRPGGSAFLKEFGDHKCLFYPIMVRRDYFVRRVKMREAIASKTSERLAPAAA